MALPLSAPLQNWILYFPNQSDMTKSFPSALVFGGNTNSFLTISISGLKLLGEGEFAEEVESILKGFYRKMEVGFPLLIFCALSAADRAQPHPFPLRSFNLLRFPESFREGAMKELRQFF